MCYVHPLQLPLLHGTDISVPILSLVFFTSDFIFLSAVACALNRLSSLLSPDLPAVAADPCAASTARLYGTCVHRRQ